jgi:hypothetical protein
MHLPSISKLNNHKIRSKIIFIFLFLAVAASFSYLFIKARYDPKVPFLKTDANANWILYPFSAELNARRANYTNLITEFTRNFELTDKPPKAYLYIKGFKECRLWINDNRLSGGSTGRTNWKKTQAMEISQFLKEGTNTLSVEVANEYGPPALWLYSRGLQNDIKTDTMWTASVLGSPPVEASLANDCFLHPISSQGMRPFDALSKKFPVLISFFLISSAVFWLSNYRQKGTKANFCQTLHSLMCSAKCILAICIVLWIIVFLNNAPKIPIDSIGFDHEGHLDYVQYLLDHKSLPLANEGWETHQPPLFYLASAAIMSLARLFLDQCRALYSLKLIPFLCGIGQICLACFAARIVFPNSKTRQNLSIVIAALIPMNIYIASYFSNESLSALLMSLAILVTVIILKDNRSSPKLYCILGLVIGLAFLTKITILTILPVIFLVLLHKLLYEEKCPITKLGGNLGWMFLVIVVVAGWHYVRNWMHFGKAYVTPWVSPWWQDPGFHTYRYFCQFGKVFTVPYFAGTYSFFDSLYSTFWGDSFFGGIIVYMFRPPWNYEYTSAVYLLAIPATLAIIIGIVCAIGNIIRTANKSWLLILGSLFAATYSIVYLNLQIPYYCHAKAFFGLGVILPISLIFAFGFDYMDNWLKDKKLSLLRVVLYGWFGTLILAILLSFFAGPNQVCVIPLHILAKEGKLDKAVAYYKQLVQNDPNDWDAHHELAKAYILHRNHDKVIEHYKKALKLRQNSYILLNNIASELMNNAEATLADKRKAVEYAEQSCRLTGYLELWPVMTLVSAYVGTEQSAEAIMTAEKVIKLAVSSGETDVAENTRKWLEQYKQQVQLKPSPVEDDIKP